MPRKAPAVPQYKLHKASGQAYVQIGKNRRYLGVWETPASKEAYARFLAEWAVRPLPEPSSAALPSGLGPSELTVAELGAHFWTHADAYYRGADGRHTDHIGTVKRALGILAELYGDRPAVAYGPLAALATQEALVRRGLSRTTINSTTAEIRRIFRWGVSRELIPAAIFHALQAVPGLRKGRTAAREPRKILPVDDQVVEATLPHLPPITADMVRFQQLTGARPSEVCNIKPGCLDRSGRVWRYLVTEHKTAYLDKQRFVFIGPKAQAVLLPYLLRPADAFCFSPAESVAKLQAEKRAKRKTKVQPSQVNRRKPRPKRLPRDHFTRDTYARSIRKGINKANRQLLKEAEAAGLDRAEVALLPLWAPNQLRHAVGTKVRREFGLEAAQVTLGHANARITETYAERDFEKAVSVAAAIG